MDYNPKDHDTHKAASRLLNNFERLLIEFKHEHVKTAAKSISRMTKQSVGSGLVDALKARQRIELQEHLLFSSSTLLVVPNPLLSHWEVNGVPLPLAHHIQNFSKLTLH